MGKPLEIKPCIECGYYPKYGVNDFGHSISCNNCGISAQDINEAHVAIKSWNKMNMSDDDILLRAEEIKIERFAEAVAKELCKDI